MQPPLCARERIPSPQGNGPPVLAQPCTASKRAARGRPLPLLLLLHYLSPFLCLLELDPHNVCGLGFVRFISIAEENLPQHRRSVAILLGTPHGRGLCQVSSSSGYCPRWHWTGVTETACRKLPRLLKHTTTTYTHSTGGNGECKLPAKSHCRGHGRLRRLAQRKRGKDRGVGEGTQFTSVTLGRNLKSRRKREHTLHINTQTHTTTRARRAERCGQTVYNADDGGQQER